MMRCRWIRDGTARRKTTKGYERGFDKIPLFSLVFKIIISCSTIFIAPSEPDLLIPVQRKQFLEIYCRFGYGFFASCAYNGIIIIACCYYAFRARKLPDNFNESKFIGVNIYSTLIIGLAAVPVYITATNVPHKIAALSVTLLFNVYLTLFCLYLPKVYAIHFAKDEIQTTRRTPLASISKIFEKEIRDKSDP